jgi:hypothetical protein
MQVATLLGGDDVSEDAIPGYRNYVVYTDESGIHGAKYYGFASLWIPWERRGDLVRQVSALREKHRLQDELKWTKVTRRSEPLARDVIDWFFARPWMMFHAIVIPRSDVKWRLHKGRDEAQQKHFTMLLKNKVLHFAKGGGRLYRIRVDPLPWKYKKSNEVVEKIANAQLKKELGAPMIHDVIPCDSKRTVGIQIADLLLGAVMEAWQQASEDRNSA